MIALVSSGTFDMHGPRSNPVVCGGQSRECQYYIRSRKFAISDIHNYSQGLDPTGIGDKPWTKDVTTRPHFKNKVARRRAPKLDSLLVVRGSQ